MLINQNFSIPADDDAVVSLVVDESVDPDILTIAGATIWWYVWPMQYACVIPGSHPLILKTTGDGSIVIPGSPPLTFYISIDRADTVGLLRNYFHEARVLSPQLELVTVAQGVMTVLPTEGRQA